MGRRESASASGEEIVKADERLGNHEFKWSDFLHGTQQTPGYQEDQFGNQQTRKSSGHIPNGADFWLPGFEIWIAFFLRGFRMGCIWKPEWSLRERCDMAAACEQLSAGVHEARPQTDELNAPFWLHFLIHFPRCALDLSLGNALRTTRSNPHTI